MKRKNLIPAVKRAKAKVSAALLAASMVVVTNPAFATIVEDANDAITAAKTDGLTVGGYVVTAIGALIVIGMVITMVRKV